MERMTRMAGEKRVEGYELAEKNENEAVDRLGRFEDVYDAVRGRLEQIEGDMERMKTAGKTKSVQFRELLVQKVSMENFMNLFGLYGIE